MDQQLEARVRSHAPIPIQNLYYLLCYAWNQLEQAQVVDVSAMSSDVPADLFATVLVKGIEHLRRRGLNVGYRTEHEILAGVRGRIDILETERRFLAQHGHAACHFDELTIDTPANRILKSTLKLLARRS